MPTRSRPLPSTWRRPAAGIRPEPHVQHVLRHLFVRRSRSGGGRRHDGRKQRRLSRSTAAAGRRFRHPETAKADDLVLVAADLITRTPARTSPDGSHSNPATAPANEPIDAADALPPVLVRDLDTPVACLVNDRVERAAALRSARRGRAGHARLDAFSSTDPALDATPQARPWSAAASLAFRGPHRRFF